MSGNIPDNWGIDDMWLNERLALIAESESSDLSLLKINESPFAYRPRSFAAETFAVIIRIPNDKREEEILFDLGFTE